MSHAIRTLVFVLILCVPQWSAAQSGGTFDLSWPSIGPPGGLSAGTGFTLSGVAAPSHAARASGGVFTLQGDWGGSGPTTDTPSALPSAFAWQPARPNPFTHRTSIGFALPHSEHVELAAFDLRGRRVRTLLNERLAPGTHQLEWDGAGDGGPRLPAGIYFLKLDAGDVHTTSRVVLMR
jgi:hypothetical protein